MIGHSNISVVNEERLTYSQVIKNTTIYVISEERREANCITDPQLISMVKKKITTRIQGFIPDNALLFWFGSYIGVNYKLETERSNVQTYSRRCG